MKRVNRLRAVARRMTKHRSFIAVLMGGLCLALGAANTFAAQTAAPTNMVLVPAGAFQMGDATSPFSKWKSETYSIEVSAFYMDKYEVTGALWDEVYLWATNHGYAFERRGSAKAPNHPVHTLTWDDKVKWCNARSEMEGREPVYYADPEHKQVFRRGPADIFNRHVQWRAAGYRLPTEAEWEKAAWGGPQAEKPYQQYTLTEKQANFRPATLKANERAASKGYRPDLFQGPPPYTTPVGSYAPNGYGLYDLAGNVREACWDLFYMFPDATGTFTGRNPLGFDRPAYGVLGRVVRGGCWQNTELFCHPSTVDLHDRYLGDPTVGFRTVISAN